VHQDVLGYVRKRVQNTILEIHFDFCSGGDYQETVETKVEPLHDFTNCQRDAF
jgi:hypothetical protein